MKTKKYVTPKFARVYLTPARHKKLAMQAKKSGTTIAEVAEEQFKIAAKKK